MRVDVVHLVTAASLRNVHNVSSVMITYNLVRQLELLLQKHFRKFAAFSACHVYAHIRSGAQDGEEGEDEDDMIMIELAAR